MSSDLPLAPTLTGPGEITSWEINATLPAGLNFGTSNGTIWGIPTQLFTTSNFTIWANNSGGSTSVELNITIVAQLPALSYSPTSLNLTNNTVSSDLPLNATLVGSGEITSWAINATLPSGLNFGTNNGTIWGVPTQLFNTSNFTIWANNSGGSLNATITLTIVDQLPQLSYTPSELVLTNNTDSSEMPMVPYLNGSGEILTWELEGTLPSGLNFETSNGTIWGIANELMPSTNYTIWANNSGGSASTQISITVVDQLPNLSYIPNTLELTNNTESEDFPLEATLIGNGEILTWELSSELPEGLLFGQNNGTFWGVPTELYPPTNFTVWANNSGGSVSANITITVFDQVPVVSYDPSTVALLNDSSVLQLTPISTGGAISSWTIDPQPSSGLYFDTETGIFAGTPIQTAASVQYLITASNDVGSISVTVNITVEDLEYELMNGTLMLVNNSILHAYPPISEIFSAHYEIDPDLPDGLYFDSVNGTIWGTPIEVLQSTIFIVYANNTLFNDTFSVLIEVVEDTDLDGLPDDLSGFDSFNGYIEDLDDDDDGFSDIMEVDCISDPLDENSIPNDLDGDGICDALDIDLDGDGLYNIIEDNSSVFKSKFNPGTNPTSPDSDGDGVCDGPKVPANGGCTLGPDAFPLDPSAHTDTDGDGKPDNMFGNSISEPPLELDMDDDNDRWTDADEVACGTDSLDELSIPNDTDGDGICDNLDDVLDLPFNLTYPNTNLTLTLGEEMNAFLPNVTGLGGVSSWEIVGQLPGGLTFGERQARASSLDGGIRGTPNETLEPTEYTIWANNSLHHRWYKITLQVSEDSGAAEDEDSPIQWGYLFCPLIILILVFIVLVLIPKEKVKLKDAEPKNTKSKPKCKAGLGTKEEPFILRSATAQSGELLLSKETFTIDNISPANLLDIVDLNKMSNGGRFRLANLQSRNESSKQGEYLVSKIPSSEFGVVQFKLAFDDRDEPTEGEQTYHAKIKVGNESVYFKWDVEVE